MSTIKLYKITNEKKTAFHVVAPTAEIAQAYATTLLEKGYFLDAKKIISIVEEKTNNATIYYQAIHRTIEAISWSPSGINLNIMKVLQPHIKALHTLMGLPEYNIVYKDNQLKIFIAKKEHVNRLLEVDEGQFIVWTYAYDTKKAPIRNYLSIEGYILALQSTIIAHDQLYEQSQSIITDSEYDQLYNTLIKLESHFPYMVHQNSPTQRIVASNIVDSLEKVRHSRPMISLDKTTTDEGIQKFIEQGKNEPILAQNKEDGLTVVGIYQNGSAIDFVSRGNGEIGERLHHSCSQIQNLPKTIDFKGKLELRFEVVVPFEAFNRLNVDGKYSNPRNLAAGTVRSLDGSLTKERGLEAYVIEVINVEGKEFTYDHERLDFVKQLGFEVSDTTRFFMPGTNFEQEKERLLTFVREYNTMVRPTLPHMIDGLVLKFDRLSLREQLGETSKFPRWAIAYKFSSQDAMTTLRDIVIQIGKSGQLSPVAQFDKVEIDGVEVRRATLHNFTLIAEKDIRIGDQIQIARANDVIPQVVKSYPELRKGNEIKLTVPSVCPECLQLLVKDGEHIFCKNTECVPKVLGKLQHFASRNAMNIDGCGEKTLELLFDKGFIKDFTDIYKLDQHASSIMQLENFGEKKVNKMLTGIEASKTRALNNVLYSLSINHIGQTASKAIAKVYPDMNVLLNEEPSTLERNLLSLDDFGEKMVQSFIDFITIPKNIAMLKELMSMGLTMESDYIQPSMESKISGKTFVITGTLSSSRNDFKKKIESLGGKVSGTVSKKTDFLLMGDSAEGTSKHKDAIKNNVTILNEMEFNSLL